MSTVSGRKWIAAAGGFLLAVGGLRAFTSRQRRWGATAEDVGREMPGDEIVPAAEYRTTRGISVSATPDCIYPWLKQMGYQRGGLYSYDFLDRIFGFLDAPSAREVLPEFQDLGEGDLIPVGRGDSFPVWLLRPNEAFVLGDPQRGWSWATCLYPQPDGTTRLVTRNRGRVRGRLDAVMLFGLDLAAFVMVRRWLIVLKQRAEGLAADRKTND